MTNEKKPLLFEVCCGSAEDAIEAAKGGAQSAGRQIPAKTWANSRKCTHVLEREQRLCYNGRKDHPLRGYRNEG